MRVLVTGGAGYIGSHTCLELLKAGHEVVVVDNLCNSSAESLLRVAEITGRRTVFQELDLLDRAGLSELFSREPVDAVIHEESIAQLLLAVTGLPASEQELIFAYYFDERAQAAIARDLGVTEKSIESRLYRARGRLRSALRKTERSGEA